MFKKIKQRLGPTNKDLKLADQIRKLYETHEVTIVTTHHGGWRVSVKKKESK